jgi:hypothetical protein
MTSGSSIDAMIRTDPPHFSHFSISMANTRLSRCAHVIEPWRPKYGEFVFLHLDGPRSTPNRSHSWYTLNIMEEGVVSHRILSPKPRFGPGTLSCPLSPVPCPLSFNPHIKHFDNREHGYGLVDLYQDRAEVDLRVVQSPRERSGNKARSQAKFVVEADNPGVQDA